MLVALALLGITAIQAEASAPSLADFKCEVRYELAAALRREAVCEQWIVLHPLCRKDLEVAFSETAPYVYLKNGKVQGVIPGI